MNDVPMRTLVVDGGYAEWRTQALHALTAGWAPETITWTEFAAGSNGVAEQMSLDYAQPAQSGAGQEVIGGAALAGGVVRVSRELAGLLRTAAAFRWSGRWAFLYRALWRWQHGDRAVALAADEDGARLHAMGQAVRRARHDMIAYVRFRGRDGEGVPQYLAWYEPEHDVLADVAEHFARRMGSSSWCIGTPQGAALWDGRTLQLTEKAVDVESIRTANVADDVEPLWLIYYQSIFNPARLNESALQQRMPVRFWKGLPEGALIPAMIAEARNGARQVGQAGSVGNMPGKQVAVDAQQALPLRVAPTSLEQCRRCDLWRHATQAVPGQGPATARLMLIGEQPGDQEDLAGTVFVGSAGQVLDEALRRAGVPRDSLFLTNAVKHFKWVARGKRRTHQTPAQREVDACSHWLQAELNRVRPAAIVTLGATALGAVLGRKVSLQRHLAEPVRLDQGWLIATWHPSYALRVDTPAAREKIVSAIAEAIALGQRLSMGTVAPR